MNDAKDTFYNLVTRKDWYKKLLEGTLKNIVTKKIFTYIHVGALMSMWFCNYKKN